MEGIIRSFPANYMFTINKISYEKVRRKRQKKNASFMQWKIKKEKQDLIHGITTQPAVS